MPFDLYSKTQALGKGCLEVCTHSVAWLQIRCPFCVSRFLTRGLCFTPRILGFWQLERLLNEAKIGLDHQAGKIIKLEYTPRFILEERRDRAGEYRVPACIARPRG